MKKIISIFMACILIFAICSCSLLQAPEADGENGGGEDASTPGTNPGNEGEDNSANGGNGDSSEDNSASGEGESGEPDDNKGDGDIMDEYTPSATVMSVKGGAESIVVLQHDDGNFSTAVVMDALLREYGLVADVAMLANKVWDEANDKPKAITKNWQELLDTERWKMVSHSTTHTWWGNATDLGGGEYEISDNIEKMYNEIEGSQEMIRKAFPGERVLAFAYPGFSSETSKYTDGSDAEIFEYIYSPKARELIGETYIVGRKSTGDFSVTDSNVDWSMTACHHVGGNYTTNYVNNSIKNKTLTVLFVHNVAEVPIDQLDSYDYPSNTMADYYFELICKDVAAGVAKGDIWNTHLEDAVMYLREAQAASLQISGDKNAVYVILEDELEDEIYNYPLTVEITVPDSWEAVRIEQDENVSYARVNFKPAFSGDSYVALCDIVPNGSEVTITPCSILDIPEVEAGESAPTPVDPNKKITYTYASIADIPEMNLTGATLNIGELSMALHIQDNATASFSSVTENGEKYLKFEKSEASGTTSTQVWLNLVRKTGSDSSGGGVLFEARMKMSLAKNSVYFRIYNGRSVSANGGTAHESTAHTITESGGSIYFAGASLGVRAGEWFTLRAEISEGGELTVSVMNGDGEFTPCFTKSGYGAFASASCVTFMSTSAGLFDFGMSSCKFEKTEAEGGGEEILPSEDLASPGPATFDSVSAGSVGSSVITLPGLALKHHIQTNADAGAAIVSAGENKYLHIEKTIGASSSAQNWINIIRDTSSDGEASGVAFEARMRMSIQGSDVCFRMYTGRDVSSNGGTAHESTAHRFAEKNGVIYFAGTDIGVAPEEWFTMKGEISSEGIFTFYLKNESGESVIHDGIEYADGDFLPYFTNGGYEAFANANGVTFTSFNATTFSLDIDYIVFDQIRE